MVLNLEDLRKTIQEEEAGTDRFTPQNPSVAQDLRHPERWGETES